MSKLNRLHEYELDDFNPLWSFIRGVYYFFMFPLSHEFKVYISRRRKEFETSFHKRIVKPGEYETIEIDEAIRRLKILAEKEVEAHSEVRLGQATSIILYYKNKDIYFMIHGSSVDPFYEDSSLPAFYCYLKQNFKKVSWRVK